MRTRGTIASSVIALVAVAVMLWFPVTGQAQSSREVHLTLDTVVRNVCGSKTFQMALRMGDVPVSDSLYGVRMTVAWDRTTIRLDDFVVVGGTTVGGTRWEAPYVYRDLVTGTLYIELANTGQSPVAGTGRPLLFLQGSIIADDTVENPYGWVDVISAEFTSSVQYDPLLRYAGLVRVIRDTTAAYTGSLAISSDTIGVREDSGEVVLTLGNVAGRRVREVHVELVADSGVHLVDTLTAGTLYRSVGWESRSVEITGDTVRIDLVDTDDLTTGGELIRIVVERASDTSVTAPIRLTRFNVNGNSCLGRLTQSDGLVAVAERQRDSTVGVVEGRDGEGMEMIVEGRVLIVRGVEGVVEVEIIDMTGRRILREVREGNGTEWRLKLDGGLATGTYLIVLRGTHRAINRKFTVQR